MDDDSSIDGDLEEFLRKNGIDSLAVPPGGSLPEGVYGDPEVDAADLSSYETVEKYSRRSEISGASEAIKLSLPTVLKVSQLLVDNGYDVQTMTAGDVDESKKVSVYVIDEWARSILGCLEEMTVRLETHHAAVTDAALTSRKVEVSHEALETRVRVLQDKLLEAERKVKASDAKVLRMEEEQARSNKSKKMDSGEVKKAMRGLEEKVEVGSSYPPPRLTRRASGVCAIEIWRSSASRSASAKSPRRKRRPTCGIARLCPTCRARRPTPAFPARPTRATRAPSRLAKARAPLPPRPR